MTDLLELPRLRKSWHVLRRRLGLSTSTPSRLVVAKAPWLNDARSPVMLMIDDLTNAWHSRSGDTTWEHGGDWGGGFRTPGSTMRFLEDRLLTEFPEARVTFFTVAGPLSSYTYEQPFAYAAPLDGSEDSVNFFRSLAEDPRFELAYHGYNHGTPGLRSCDFVQEWQSFASTASAVAQTRRGLEVFRRTIGRAPLGGKYGGWAYNGFAEEAINECGFVWWCRDWTPRDVTGAVPAAHYEPQMFGRNLVVSLPSTVHGYFWDRRQVDLLLKHRQVISIAEHIAPVRPDGLVQTPNIFDDMGELQRLYRYLRGKNVWHATGSQIASYVVARERTLVHDVTKDGFSLRYEGRVDRPHLTLRLDCSVLDVGAAAHVEVVQPDGAIVESAPTLRRSRRRDVVTVRAMTGRYEVRLKALSDDGDPCNAQ